MYRRHALQSPRRAFAAALAGRDIAKMARDAVLALLISTGMYEQAQRDNRKRTRAWNRFQWHRRLMDTGRNGNREVQRRQRQIAAGQLRAANGLVLGGA